MYTMYIFTYVKYLEVSNFFLLNNFNDHTI